MVINSYFILNTLHQREDIKTGASDVFKQIILLCAHRINTNSLFDWSVGQELSQTFPSCCCFKFISIVKINCRFFLADQPANRSHGLLLITIFSIRMLLSMCRKRHRIHINECMFWISTEHKANVCAVRCSTIEDSNRIRER